MLLALLVRILPFLFRSERGGIATSAPYHVLNDVVDHRSCTSLVCPHVCGDVVNSQSCSGLRGGSWLAASPSPNDTSERRDVSYLALNYTSARPSAVPRRHCNFGPLPRQKRRGKPPKLHNFGVSPRLRRRGLQQKLQRFGGGVLAECLSFTIRAASGKRYCNFGPLPRLK